MRIALYDGEGEPALGVIDYPREMLASDQPLQVAVAWREVFLNEPLPDIKHEPLTLRFQAVAVWLPTAGPKSQLVRSWIAVPFDEQSAAVVRAVFAGADAPGIPPQHQPAFHAALNLALKSKG